MAEEENILAQLMAVIESRKGATADTSYTASLFAGGAEKIGAKVREEAAEVVEAGLEGGDAGRDHLTHEAADLIYHLFVLLAHRGIQLADVETELARRFGISGHAEKAARKR